MKNGQKDKLVTKTKRINKKLIKSKQPRIYEFVQGVNGLFSNKRLMAITFAVASIAYAFIVREPIITGIFAGAATGSSVGGNWEKKQQ